MILVQPFLQFSGDAKNDYCILYFGRVPSENVAKMSLIISLSHNRDGASCWLRGLSPDPLGSSPDPFWAQIVTHILAFF